MRRLTEAAEVVGAAARIALKILSRRRSVIQVPTKISLRLGGSPLMSTTISILGHRATLGQTVVLPAISPNDAAFWPTRPRRQTVN